MLWIPPSVTLLQRITTGDLFSQYRALSNVWSRQRGPSTSRSGRFVGLGRGIPGVCFLLGNVTNVRNFLNVEVPVQWHYSSVPRLPSCLEFNHRCQHSATESRLVSEWNLKLTMPRTFCITLGIRLVPLSPSIPTKFLYQRWMGGMMPFRDSRTYSDCIIPGLPVTCILWQLILCSLVTVHDR